MHSGLKPNPKPFPATRARSVWALVAFLVVGLPAACRPVPAPEFRGVVKVGLVAPFSGPEWSVGYEALFAARAAVNRWNLEGRSYPAQLVAQDDRSTAEFGRLEAEKLAADPGVVAVIGHPAWASLSAAVPVYRRAGLPLVNYWTPAVPTDGPVYYLAPPWSEFEAAAAGRLGGSRLAVVFDPNVCPWVGPGPGVTGGVAVDYLAPDVSPAGLGPAAGVLVCADGLTAGRWVSARREPGRPDPQILLGPPAYSGGLRNLLGPSRGALLVPVWDLPAAEAAAFAAAFREAGGGEPGPAAVAAYQAARLVLWAVEQAVEGGARPTRDRVRAALQGVDPQAVVGRVDVGVVDIGP